MSKLTEEWEGSNRSKSPSAQRFLGATTALRKGFWPHHTLGRMQGCRTHRGMWDAMPTHVGFKAAPPIHRSKAHPFHAGMKQKVRHSERKAVTAESSPWNYRGGRNLFHSSLDQLKIPPTSQTSPCLVAVPDASSAQPYRYNLLNGCLLPLLIG